LSAIDASYVEDDVGWLVYKINGNASDQPTPIFIRELTADGLSFAPGSTAVQLIVNDLDWEGGVVEAPWITRHDDMFYLFYSGNVYDERYRTGVARSSVVTGPYAKHGDPILGNNERWVGPGHGSVVAVGDLAFFFFHAWTNAGGGVNDEDAGRQGLADRIEWVDGWPRIHDGSPSRTWQPWPGT
jgi:beta-xylosidase